MIVYREFWEARDRWYPTWGNGTTEDNALQVDYIRIYAATTTNSKNQDYNVGGRDGNYLWQANCTFDDFESSIIQSEPTDDESEPNRCVDACFNVSKDCNTFYTKK